MLISRFEKKLHLNFLLILVALSTAFISPALADLQIAEPVSDPLCDYSEMDCQICPNTDSTEGECMGFLDWAQLCLDGIGTFEPTPFCDLTNTAISCIRGNFGDAGLSLCGVLPFVGDAAKCGKYGPKIAKACTKQLGPKFTSVKISEKLMKTLNGIAGPENAKKFQKALGNGVVGPTGQQGIKILKGNVHGYTHELKINGSAQRILGRIDETGPLVFDKFLERGLH